MTLDEDLEEAGGATRRPVHPGVRRARAWLSRAVEPGMVDFWRFVDDVGPVEAVRLIRSGGAPDRILASSAPGRGRTRRSPTSARAERCGARLVDARGRRVAGVSRCTP